MHTIDLNFFRKYVIIMKENLYILKIYYKKWAFEMRKGVKKKKIIYINNFYLYK